MNTIQRNSAYTELGATALDNIDGNMTSQIQITGTVNTATLGTYTRTYSATDSAGNVGTATRTIIVQSASPPPPVDNQSPVVTLIGQTTKSISLNATYTEDGATAIDNVDGNLTSQLQITGTVNTAIAGSYNRIYSVIDSAGNIGTATRTIVVQPAPPPAPASGSLMTSATIFASSELGGSLAELKDGDLANTSRLDMRCRENHFIEIELQNVSEVSSLEFHMGRQSDGNYGWPNFEILANDGGCFVSTPSGNITGASSPQIIRTYSPALVTKKIRFACRDSATNTWIREIKINGSTYTGNRGPSNCQTSTIYPQLSAEYSSGVYLPPSYNDNLSERFPVIISLHGAGGKILTTDHSAVRSSPEGFIKQMNKTSMKQNFEAIVLAPHFAPAGNSGAGWLDGDRVHRFVKNAMKEFKMDSDRVVVTGLSAGGYATKEIIEKYRDTIYAGFVPVAANGNSSLRCQYRFAPIFVHTGANDSHSLYEWTRTKDVIIPGSCSPNNSSNMNLVEHPGLGHSSALWDTAVYSSASVHEFMLDVRRSNWINTVQ